MNKKQIAIIGSGKELNEKVRVLAEELGEKLVEQNYRILCGGLGGAMEAVCRGAHKAKNYTEGTTVGILPTIDKDAANKYVDIRIATGMGYVRNQVLIASADAVVGISGGAGTLSEIAFAWQYEKPIILLDKTGGWSEKLGGKKIDESEREPTYKARNVEEVLELLKKIL
ncbi:MAG: TIGR00725 family protein [Candidatus Heimdallarchaeaceae archaeon]